MSAWRIVVNFAIPPALVLTVLLILPTPTLVKRWLLVFTRRVLFLNVVGTLRLVHVMMALTGMAFAVCSNEIIRLQATPVDEASVTPNQRIHLLAKKWRGERNWWIAALAFLLWGFLYRFYQLAMTHLALEDDAKKLRIQVSQLKAQLVHAGAVPQQSQQGPAGVQPLKEFPASAPPAPAPASASAAAGKADAGVSYRGKAKAI